MKGNTKEMIKNTVEERSARTQRLQQRRNEENNLIITKKEGGILYGNFRKLKRVLRVKIPPIYLYNFALKNKNKK